MTIREAIDECILQLKNTKAENTIRTYSNGFKVFIEYLGETANNDISLLTPQHFIDFPSWLIRHYENKRSASLREISVRYLRNWLHHKRYIQWSSQDETDYNFTKDNSFSERSFPLPKKIPSADIMKAIDYVPEMDTFRPIERLRNIAIIYLLSFSGIRVSEVAALMVSDVIFDEENSVYKIFVRKAKEGKSYFVPISNNAASAIKFYWLERGWYAPDDPCFARHDKQVSDRHEPISDQGIQLMMRKLRKQAGITSRLTPHKFRHDVATELAKKYGVQVAKEWLHHENIRTTQVYIDMDDGDIMAIAKDRLSQS